VLKEQERGAGAAVNVLGYRLAMLVSGALALIVAAGGELFGFDLGAGIGWPRTYFWIAALMLIGVAATLAAPEPRVPAAAPKTLQAAVVGPFKEFFSRRGALALLLLIILYKLGDAFALSLSSAFLIRGMQFSAGEVGAVNKVWGLAATIIGVLIGGGLMVKLGLFRSLLVFGILQAVSNLAYMWLALSGKSYALMVSAVGIDNVAGGMGTTAFVALLMAMCDHRFTATQYALLSALAAVGRVYVGPAAGWLTDPTGYGMQWGPFFFVTFLCALPGLVLLVLMRGTILRLSDDAAQNRAAEAKT
jgi:MFS transporter, PAT family, beta-lactamase induction signal transducer AmpG